MEIWRYSNEQYAGMHGQDLAFRPGMNVVLGDNETGKSTVIVGIYDTLLVSSKINRKTGKSFVAQRFPTNRSTSIDGTVGLTVNGRRLTVKKEWDLANSDPRTVLLFDTGEKFTGPAAEEELCRLLAFGAGVYDHIVFGRQSNEAAVLDWYFGFMEAGAGGRASGEVLRARQDVGDVLSAAGGVSEEQYLKKLDEKLEELGALWDFAAQGPKNRRGIRNPYNKGVGQILAAYYALENRRQEQADARELLAGYEALKTRLETLGQERERLETQNRELQAQEHSAALESSRQAAEKELARMERALEEWPRLEKEYAHLAALKQEAGQRQNRDKRQALQQALERARDLGRRRETLRQAAGPLKDAERDGETCRRLLRRAGAAQASLSSGKLHASIALQPGYTATLTTAGGTGAPVGARCEQDVDGFALIEIPGVGEIRVAPQNLDIPALQGQIEADRAAAGALLEKYGVADLAGLEGKAAAYAQAVKDLDRLELELARLPGGSVEALEAALQSIPLQEDVAVREDLDSAIRLALAGTGADTLEERMAVVASALRGYERENVALARLREAAARKREEAAGLGERLRALPPCPLTMEAYQAQKRRLDAALYGVNGSGGLLREIDELNREIGAKEEAANEVDLAGLEAGVQELQRQFEAKKRLYSQYSRIRADFLALKEAQGDRFAPFYRQLDEYLSLVTGGQVRLGEGATLQSRQNRLPARELLSRGTQQAVLLAFRLALLRFYFQQEGGLVVLDDVLLDMDPGRRQNAARLLQAFAGGNQVIFTTCDPAIAELLGGHLIRLGP
ncbi:ATP-binding protein [Acutalibacter caecimuris]|uniref:ATP-binding protein n=1 Tax=Acutalibacter caecimuris TaxID=3093657 RepID=UPI002AC8FB5E|nr:hypothetical protein [Acutalibacter sp. M00118]